MGSATSAHTIAGDLSGGQLPGLEAPTLGDSHAREHAALRRAIPDAEAEWDRLNPSERAERLAEDVAEQKRMERAAGSPQQDGAWTTSPFPIPNFAIHMTLLPTGKVLFWGYPPEAPNRPNEGEAAIWNPALGTGPGSMTQVPPPLIDVDDDGDLEAAPIYCSGQSLLPSGEVLVTGGNLVWPAPAEEFTGVAGADEAFTFNPWDESWTQQPSMHHGRWYPTQVELADGRTAILGGLDETPPQGQTNNELEIFTPSATPGGIGQMSYLPGADRQSELYPISFLLRDGNLLTAAPSTPGILDTNSFSWAMLPSHLAFRRGASGVMLPGGPAGATEVMVMGGAGSEPDANGIEHARASSELLDTAPVGGGWEPGPDYNVSRSTPNVVQLPDGSMVSVGGGAGFSPERGYWHTDETGQRRQIEIFDPAGGGWRLGPPQEEDRTYHSTAVLLPDGRVLSAGDDFHPSVDGSFSQSDTAEIYSPPYLFRGPRPQIDSAPAEIRQDNEFTVATSGGAIERAVLMAPGATTHGFDMQQRHVELKVTGINGGSLTLRPPSSGGVAPPGHYMLFVLNDQGVPSVARWVAVRTFATPPPPPGPAPHASEQLPKLSVTLDPKPKGKRRGPPRLHGAVTVDSAAAVEVEVLVLGARRRPLGRLRVEFAAAGAGSHPLAMKLKRGDAKRVRRASVTARATGAGGTSNWAGSVKLLPRR
jgi:Domain of unknown function (DUF1929)